MARRVKVRGVVLEDEDPVPLAGAWPERELDGEDGPLVGRALEVDRPAVQLDQLLGQRQAEAGSRVLPVAGALHLVEGAEDLVLDVFGDADAAVFNRYPKRLALDRGLQADFPRGRCELDGIRQEVVEDLRSEERRVGKEC